ncbi:MAG: SMP-30/gluconolactonase/LRE family protein, partial [Planctomycetes bacterium]|nr:SMP-30/gluconolactonase/LRE family protein [Planctomycetota bacterium]
MSLRTISLALLLPALAHAQGVEGGDILVSDYAVNGVFRIDHAGTVTTLHAGAPLTSASGLAVNGALDVFIANYNNGTIYRIPRGGAIAPFASGISGPIRLAVDHDGTLLVTSLAQKALLRVDGTGQSTPIASGAPFVRPFGIAVDVDGSYLVADDGAGGGANAPALYRVSRGGQVTPIWQGAPFRLPQGVALLPDGDFAVSDGLVDCVFRVPRAGGAPTIVVVTPAIDNPDALCEDFEGRVLVAESSAAGNRVDLVDRGGGVQTVASGLPFRNLEVVARAPRLSGPATIGVGQTANFALRFAGEGVTPYAMWATLSVFPGLPFPAPDTRAIFGNADVLLGAT